MQKLCNEDIDFFLTNGFLSKPFLDIEFVRKMVDLDFKTKTIFKSNYTKIESLYSWINHVVKFCKNKEYIAKHKFQRTAKEIWESKLAVGCSDYALLFATFARQLGWPTTILATAEYEWLNNLQKGDNSRHSGHYFCECFYENNWVMVDPTCKRIARNYSLKKIILNYTINNSNTFIPYLRCLDLGKRQTIKDHNIDMDNMCKNKILEQSEK